MGARASLEVLTALDDRARFERARAAARVLTEHLELPDSGSSIVSVPVADSRAAGRALEEAGVRASVRAGGIRVAPHFYNRIDQAQMTAELLRPFRRPGT
ncbi:MAG: hypothetical protein AAGF23_14680 [Acidobacteriota bacterium]